MGKCRVLNSRRADGILLVSLIVVEFSSFARRGARVRSAAWCPFGNSGLDWNKADSAMLADSWFLNYA